MIAPILNPDAVAWIAANRERMEAEADAWMRAHGESFDQADPPYPTTALEQALMSELIDCMGMQLVRPMIESLAPIGGWPKLTEVAP